MRSALNLATRPLRNMALPILGLALLSVVLAGLTVWHALRVRSLAGAGVGDAWDEITALRSERERLGIELARLTRQKGAAASAPEWAILKGLVDQRAFGWTEMLARLEDVLPSGVRLLSITPRVGAKGVSLSIEAVARTPQEVFAFVRKLEDRDEFGDVYLSGSSDDVEGTRCQVQLRYTPQLPSMPAPGKVTQVNP
jgi:Tfp pilus assembly protein PilN